MNKWSSTFRIWHWLFALTILFMSTTVLLRDTVLDKEANGAIITENISTLYDVNITKEDSMDVAKQMVRPLWKWHILIGYLFAGLVFARMLLFLTDSGKQNYIKCDEKTMHKKVVGAIYLGLYGFAVIEALTGLGIKFHGLLGISEELEHTVKEIHEFAFYAILAFVIVHIAGVVIAENKDEKGIVSDMINGGKKS
ncbi:MAG: cytochrome b/b6 domain-containing protein [Sulfurovaceae bacterium]|nr:cytochrome b/b6 domain-containing protein [Sulfurovaceae bacterium]